MQKRDKKQLKCDSYILPKDDYLNLLLNISNERKELNNHQDIEKIEVNGDVENTNEAEINVTRFKKQCLRLAKNKSEKENMKTWFNEYIFDNDFIKQFMLKFDIPLYVLGKDTKLFRLK